MKFQNFKFNETYAFFIFVAFLSFLAFIVSGVNVLPAFISAVFIYIFLRFANFLWGLIMKLLSTRGVQDGTKKL